jgi:enoyl-CoA hydratase/carnithine racemase
MHPVRVVRMEPVGSHDAGPVRVLTLRRPAARNAMSTALLAALLDALARAVADGAVRAIVLTGEGGHFSAGADLREPLDHDARVRRMELFGAVYQAIGTCPTPTIAAVSGACVGGGAEAAAACDLRVADRTARFRFPGAALGFPVGAAKLVGLVGLGSAKDLVLTARTVDAPEAQRLGLVQRLVDADPLSAAVAVGADIAANAAAAVAHLKRQFERFSGLGDRIAAEADDAYALAEADGDFAALTMRNPRAGWTP